MTERPRFDHLVALDRSIRHVRARRARHPAPRARVLRRRRRARPRRQRSRTASRTRRSAPWPRVRSPSSATPWDHTASVAIADRPTGRGRAKVRPRTAGDGASGDWARPPPVMQFAIAGPARSLFERGAETRSQYPRAMAFAALGRRRGHHRGPHERGGAFSSSRRRRLDARIGRRPGVAVARTPALLRQRRSCPTR